jgi:hypothetical protein
MLRFEKQMQMTSNRISSADPYTSTRGVPKAFAPPSAVQAFSFVHLCEQVRTVHK